MIVLVIIQISFVHEVLPGFDFIETREQFFHVVVRMPFQSLDAIISRI